MSIRNFIIPEHIDVFLNQSVLSEVFVYAVRKGYAPPTYTWGKFTRMRQTKRAHKFELDMLEKLYNDYTE